MGLFNRKPKVLTPEQAEEIYTKDFFDMILPSTIKFFTDYYIVGDSYRSVWAVREYPPSTEEQAILSQLADRNGVTLRIYHRFVESVEQRKIIQNATRKNKLKSSGNDVNETIEAQGNLQDVVTLMANLRKNKEPLLHCSVFIELKAKSKQKLKELQADIAMELTRSKIEVDRLTLRQKEGFLSVNPIGQISSEVYMSVFCLLHLLQICFRLISVVRQIQTVCISVEISTARISLLTLTGEQRTRQRATSLFSETAVRAKVICSN